MSKLKLQEANMYQEIGPDRKSDWQIRENGTGQVLHTLPSRISDQDMFAIIRFARQFELSGYEEGIKDASTRMTQQMDRLRGEKEGLESLIEDLRLHSDTLAERLHELLSED